MQRQTLRRASPGGERGDEDELSKVLPLRQLQQEIQRDFAIVHILQQQKKPTKNKEHFQLTNGFTPIFGVFPPFLRTHHVHVELIEASEG